ncbi:MAG: conserved hypothetical protein [Marine Group I thaumarchaeote]|nr:MAG: conserved hypothetical protein [Marine Group I thaumarchaeote]
MGYTEDEIGHPSYSQPTGTHSYQCGHCDHQTSGRVVAFYPSNGVNKWLLCTNCAKGSVLTSAGIIFPASKFGSSVEGLPGIVQKAYDEARLCYSVGAFTACELICRKILMNVAVDKGADENDSFVNYLDFLKTEGYITEAMMSWVSLIREHGGKSTHYIAEPEKTRAESTLMFTEQMLKIIYEATHRADKYSQTNTS